eukprot:1286730-Rhodomonas_salina.1
MVRHVVGMATCLLMAAFSPLPPASAFVPQTANLLSGPCRSSADFGGGLRGMEATKNVKEGSLPTSTPAHHTRQHANPDYAMLLSGDVLVAVPDRYSSFLSSSLVMRGPETVAGSAVLRVVVSEKGDDRNRLPKRLGD